MGKLGRTYVLGLCVLTCLNPAFLLFTPSRTRWSLLIMYVLAPSSYIFLLLCLVMDCGERVIVLVVVILLPCLLWCRRVRARHCERQSVTGARGGLPCLVLRLDLASMQCYRRAYIAVLLCLC